ncbi:MAG TPA: nuclear transport factor 2 family protein [Croceibacterium sp.]|nr:nuclear transport factor 2 family protein [Croceibacterium sp.]
MSAERRQQLIERAARLKGKAQRREDYQAIIRLQRTYGFYIDKGYWREASDLCVEDATFEHGVDGAYVGRERIHQVIVRLAGGNRGPGLPFGQLNEHFQLQPVITIAEGGQTAQGRWHQLSMTGQYGEHAEWGEGVYENAYRREGGVWKIAALRFYPNFVAPYEGGWASLEPVVSDWRSPALADFPPDRPPSTNYRPFPEIFVPPFHYHHPVTGKTVAR